MPREGLEPTIPVFEQEKAVHALYRAATVIGALYIYHLFQNYRLFWPYGKVNYLISK
jgi:hypothetical protein